MTSVEQAVKKAVKMNGNSRRKSGAQRRKTKRTQLKLENHELGSQTELSLKGVRKASNENGHERMRRFQELQMERVAARQKQRDIKVGSYSELKVKREDQGHESLDTFQAVPKPEPKIKLEDLDHDHKGPDILEALIKALEGMA